VISRAEMMEVLVEACRSFRPAWERFVAEWADKGPDLPHYLALAEFARHLVTMLERADTANLFRVFQVVERLHLDGDPYVREAATVGLLEDLQNRNLHTVTDPEQFRAFLLPESRRWWDKLADFWDRGVLLYDG
jgi:hypothetical protein